jgi:peptidoglycan/xylan/chitin deacetylase (PgdA/CDA1 family)
LPVASLSSPATGNRQPATLNEYFLSTRQVIPKMLGLFEKYDVHVTWAGVGMLMHKDRASLVKNFPEARPSYRHDELSAYSFMDKIGIGNNEEEDPFHYADSLVRQIVNTKHQELGSHTFSHFYCNEEGQTVEQFRADLKAAQRAASVYGKQLKSLIFPRNQFNDDYLKACWEEDSRPCDQTRLIGFGILKAHNMKGHGKD